MKCNICNNILYKNNKTGFCKECYQKERTKNKKIFKCIDCNNIIKNSKSPRCKKCSIKIVIQKNSKQILTKCNICNKKISFKKSAFERSQNHYCSKECYWKDLKNKPSNMLGKHHTEKTKQKLSKIKKGIRVSPETEFKKENYGDKSGYWKGGITSLNKWIRSLDKDKLWRKEVFTKDNYTCQECKARSGKGKTVYLEAHHIKPFSLILQEFLQIYSQFSPIEDKETLVRLSESHEPFWNIDNGQTLCKECHNKIPKNGGRPCVVEI